MWGAVFFVNDSRTERRSMMIGFAERLKKSNAFPLNSLLFFYLSSIPSIAGLFLSTSATSLKPERLKY